MKTLRVVAAVIFRSSPQGQRQVFATARGYGDWKGWWEFPGGKIEAGESAQEALVREIREELASQISVGKKIADVEWDYPDFHLGQVASRRRGDFGQGRRALVGFYEKRSRARLFHLRSFALF